MEAGVLISSHRILQLQNPTYRCAISNEAFKTLAEFFQIAGFAPTRLIIFVFRLVIGQYFKSGILFSSAGQSGDGRQRWLDVWGRTQQSEFLHFVDSESFGFPW